MDYDYSTLGEYTPIINMQEEKRKAQDELRDSILGSLEGLDPEYIEVIRGQINDIINLK